MKFIDSNVFIYAADSKNPVKRSIARKLISVAVASGGCKINVQVLNEFSSVAHRKLGLTIDEIKKAGFDAYFVDHTTGVYPQAAAGFPQTSANLQVKGDPITDLMEDLAADAACS